MKCSDRCFEGTAESPSQDSVKWAYLWNTRSTRRSPSLELLKSNKRPCMFSNGISSGFEVEDTNYRWSTRSTLKSRSLKLLKTNKRSSTFSNRISSGFEMQSLKSELATKWMRRNDRRRIDLRRTDRRRTERRRNERRRNDFATKWMRRNERDEMIGDEMSGHPHACRCEVTAVCDLDLQLREMLVIWT